MDQLTTVVADEEEDVEDPVVNGVDHQQIRRPDSPELVGEERPPRLAALWGFLTAIGCWWAAGATRVGR